ncbi:MAG TPA: hypothetical protein DDX19_25890 [Rhodopirellula baltica]|nr:hypothetical protein [Rhodopirellula baltica]
MWWEAQVTKGVNCKPGYLQMTIAGKADQPIRNAFVEVVFVVKTDRMDNCAKRACPVGNESFLGGRQRLTINRNILAAIK